MKFGTTTKSLFFNQERGTQVYHFHHHLHHLSWYDPIQERVQSFLNLNPQEYEHYKWYDKGLSLNSIQ